MFSRKKEVIGFHFGREHAAAVVLQLADQGTVLVREYAVVEVGEEEPSWSKTLRLLRGKLKTRCRECAISAWPEEARLKFFVHAAGNQARMQRILASNVQAVFHEELPDYVLSCDMLGEAEGIQGEAPFVGCGIPRSEVNALEAAFLEAGYEIQLIQLTPIAMLNAFTSSQEEAALKEPFLLADLGKHRSLVIGGSQRRMQFVRTIEIGWAAIADELQNMYGIDIHTVSDSDEIAQEAAHVAVRPLANALLESSNYLQMEYGAAQPARIHVSGALSNNPFATGALSFGVGLPCAHWNPFRRAAAKRRTLENDGLLKDLTMLPAAAGAAFQSLLQ